MTDENEGTSLKEEIQRLNQNFAEFTQQKKIKKVKGKKLSKSQVKKGWVRYMYIDENKGISAHKYQIDDGTVIHGGVPRVATADYIMTWDGQPTIIQPGWSLTPYDPVKERGETEKEKLASAGMRLLLAKIEQGNIKQKKKLSGAMIFGIIIALIVIGYLLIKGFG